MPFGFRKLDETLLICHFYYSDTIGLMVRYTMDIFMMVNMIDKEPTR